MVKPVELSSTHPSGRLSEHILIKPVLPLAQLSEQTVIKPAVLSSTHHSVLLSEQIVVKSVELSSTGLSVRHSEQPVTKPVVLSSARSLYKRLSKNPNQLSAHSSNLLLRKTPYKPCVQSSHKPPAKSLHMPSVKSSARPSNNLVVRSSSEGSDTHLKLLSVHYSDQPLALIF